ncbi:MAG: hypothetical protein DCC68_20950 [Planctomycetota bacterium]|nr:MAG: hypothetical protein DCC68_20950 [Planctomycetota bacterium]
MTFATFATVESLPPALESARGSLADSPGAIAALALVGVAVLAFWWRLYRRDAGAISPGYGWLLLALRLGVLVALALYFARFEQRVDRRERFDSRAIVLVDTSLSMARVDEDLRSSAGSLARWQLVASQLTEGNLVERLGRVHQVYVYTFDENDKPALAGAFDKKHLDDAQRDVSAHTFQSMDSGEASDAASQYERFAGTLRDIAHTTPEPLWWLLAATIAASWLMAAVWIARSGRVRVMPALDWFYAVLGTLVPAAGVFALVVLAYSQRDAVEGEAAISGGGDAASEPSANGGDSPRAISMDRLAALRESLRPKGAATRLGDALAQVLAEQRSHPISGIVVFTDGGQNAGEDPLAVAKDAKGASIPIHVVGMGSDRRRSSVRIADFAAPARVFPDDQFDVTATVQATNLKDRPIAVSLYAKAAASDAGQASAETHVATERVLLGGDGETKPVKFVLPALPVGTYHYVVRLETLTDDDDPKDNEAQASVEVVAQQMRVLLAASGPSRDYQFARNLFFRDKTIAVDVLLATAPPGPGISQDADAILGEFPRSREDLDKYDAVIAFDFDWTQLDAAQVDALVEWVDRRLGGLVVVAGPVHTIELTTESTSAESLAKIRQLYPVVFARRGVALASDTEKFRSTTPWRVELTRDGLEAPFLRLEDDASASAAAWETFEGVYGYFPVQGAKPGARVYAHYGTPDATKGPPVYMAGQFYGAGRVIYLGSGETWRLRALDEAYFERFWTKLARFAAEGRLLRGSRRGALLVENRRVTLGQRVEVRAMLQTAERDPLVVDRVAVQLSQPAGAVASVMLLPDAATPGVYRGDFLAAEQGVYRLELEAPGTPYELVAETIRAVEPDLEAEHARRDDALLSALAGSTGGKYLVGAGGPMAFGVTSAITGELRDATRYLRVRGAASATWDRLWATTLLGVICGLLFTEWTLRRLAKLA